jgi:prepilin-type N-terminal cleavage/methylation domain-containing protein
MKKGFSLIEMMIAIAVIFIGFSAVVSMTLSSISTSTSSKAKLKATSLASGILEKYRAERDASGIGSLTMFPTPNLTPIQIDGIKFLPKVQLYNIDQNTVVVETKVSWVYKSGPTPFVQNYVLLTNYDNPEVTVPAPYITPVWFTTPMPTATPTPNPTLTPTITLTPTPTIEQIVEEPIPTLEIDFVPCGWGRTNPHYDYSLKFSKWVCKLSYSCGLSAFACP